MLGIGSIRCRRWARALTLAVGWAWLATGVLVVSTMIIVVPGALSALDAGQEMGPGATTFFTLLIVGMAGMFGVAIPGGLVLFYRSPHVRMTCERKDPQPRWTDRCPIPVLVLFVFLAYSAVTSLTAAFPASPIPVMGVVLKGGLGSLVMIFMAAAYGAVALGTIRLEPWAWWGALLLTVFWGLSTYFTLRMDWENVLNAVSSESEEIQLMATVVERSQDALLAVLIVSTVVVLAFLFHVRRYFQHEAPLVLSDGPP